MNEPTPAFSMRMLPIVQGATLVATAVIAGAALLVVVGLLETAAREHLEPGQVHPWADWCFENRPWLPLLAAPGLVCGIIVMTSPRLRWIWVLLGALAVIVPVVVVIACFLLTVAPLYQPQPL